MCAHVHVHSYMTLIGVHEMHGRVHPNYATDLLVVDLRSSLAYFMMTHPLLTVNKLPTKTLVAKQLPTNIHTRMSCFHKYATVHTRTHAVYMYMYVHIVHVHVHVHVYAIDSVITLGLTDTLLIEKVLIISYSQKYWRGLNLVVGPKIAITKILADLNLAVR